MTECRFKESKERKYIMKNSKGNTTVVITIILTIVLVIMLTILSIVAPKNSDKKNFVIKNYDGIIVDKKEINRFYRYRFLHNTEKNYQFVVKYDVNGEIVEYTFDVNVDDFYDYKIGDKYTYRED